MEVDFSVNSNADYLVCLFVVSRASKAIEDRIANKLSNLDTINTTCVMDSLKKGGAMGHMLEQQRIRIATELTEDDLKTKLEDVEEKLRIIFEESAKTCNSDPTYDGLFNDVLGIKNASFAVLQRNYCFTKFVIERNLIEVENVDSNPGRINVSSIDCQTIIENQRNKTTEDLFKGISEPGQLTVRQVRCIIDEFKSRNIVHYQIASVVNEILEASQIVKRNNRLRLYDKMQRFGEVATFCIIFRLT